jgi:D-lactate dehydrogenase (cytochrome)
MSIKILDLADGYADYLHDESRREGRAEKIAFPESTEEVCEALRVAVDNRWPVTIQGGRTGITGGCVPDGGLILNLSRMNAIGSIEGGRVVVQPGATLDAIRASIQSYNECNAAELTACRADATLLRGCRVGSVNQSSKRNKQGLFFPSDLTETTATIGGMVANNASGARSFRYGSIRSWVDALRVVLPNGESVHLKRGVHKADGLKFTVGRLSGMLPEMPMPDVKTAAGYYVKPDMDLVDLFIGAEGTLGIVTEITIKLLPKPEQMSGLTAFFDSEERALAFVRFLRAGAEHPPAAIEFFDRNALELLRRMKSGHAAFAELPELKPEFHTAIYFEFDGEVPDEVMEEAGKAYECWFSEDEYEIEKLKNFRHAIPESVNLMIGERKKSIPELTKLGTDMSVPDNRMEKMMQMYHEGLAEAGLEYVIFGHIGNNHVHVNILPRSMEEYERGGALYFRWAKQVVEWGGSVSAEHGIGKLKTNFLRLMFADQEIKKMRELRGCFDPDHLLNAGNLF